MGTMKEPGFRDCRLTAKVGGKTYSHHIKVGFSPEKLQPYTSCLLILMNSGIRLRRKRLSSL